MICATHNREICVWRVCQPEWSPPVLPPAYANKIHSTIKTDDAKLKLFSNRANKMFVCARWQPSQAKASWRPGIYLLLPLAFDAIRIIPRMGSTKCLHWIFRMKCVFKIDRCGVRTQRSQFAHQTPLPTHSHKTDANSANRMAGNPIAC